MRKIAARVTVDEAVDHCRNNAPDAHDHWIVCWSIEDVRAEAEKDDLDLTDEQAQEVLSYFENHYDYVWEVSWELMGISIEECQKEWQKKAEESEVKTNDCCKR